MARAAASASAAGENRVGKDPSSTARESDITKKAHCQDMAAEGVRAARSQTPQGDALDCACVLGRREAGVFFCARAQNAMAAAKTSGRRARRAKRARPTPPQEASPPCQYVPRRGKTRQRERSGPRLWRGRRTRLPPIPRGDGPRRLPNRRQRAATANAIRGSMLREEANLRARNSAQAASSSAAKRTASSAARRILFWRAFFPA